MPKIYSYHVQLDTLPEHAFGQLKLANAYYNQLIELENKRRVEYRTLRTSSFPNLAALEARQVDLNTQIDALETQKKAENAAARTKVKNNPLVAQLRDLKAERKTVNALVKAERAEAKPFTCDKEGSKCTPPSQRPLTKEELEALPPSTRKEFSLACIQLDALDLERCKAARASCGVYWATYCRIERAVQQACKTAKMDPRFKRFKGEGCLGGQIQGGLAMDQVYLGSTVFKIDPLPATTWQGRRRDWEHAYTIAHLRIGSTADHKPIWLDLPIKLDRPLPSTGAVKEAYLKVTKLGLKSIYELKLCIDSPEFECLQPSKRDMLQLSRDPNRGSPMPPTSGVCAINFGWRSLPSGDVRVAYLVDTTGHEETINLPQRVKGAFALVERLQGFCDEQFDCAQGQLVQFLKNSQEVPEWLREMTTLAQWRSHTRLALVAIRLRDEVIGREVADALWQEYRRTVSIHGPLPSYEAITSYTPESSDLAKLAWYLEVWRKKDKHLVEYYSNLRDKCQNQRKDLYRCAAKSIASRYNVVVIDDTNFALMAMKAEVGEEGGACSGELKASKEASPGELRSTIVEKVGTNHIETLSAKNKTLTCHLCGQDHGWDTRATYIQSCPVTGREVDQDWNNCMNLLQDYERSSGVENPVPSRTGETPELLQA